MDRQNQIPHEEQAGRNRKGRTRAEARGPEGTAEGRPREEPMVEEADWPSAPTAPPRPAEHEPARERPVEVRRAGTQVIVDDPEPAPRGDVTVTRVGPRPVVDRVTMAVDYLFFLLYGLLGLRFVLSLMGASETAGFVQLVHTLTAPFYAPFQNIVASPGLDGGFVDYPILIALLAYGLLHIAARGLVRVIAGQRRVA